MTQENGCPGPSKVACSSHSRSSAAPMPKERARLAAASSISRQRRSAVDSCAEFTARRWQYSRDRSSREATGAGGGGGLAQALRANATVKQFNNFRHFRKIIRAPSQVPGARLGRNPASNVVRFSYDAPTFHREGAGSGGVAALQGRGRASSFGRRP